MAEIKDSLTTLKQLSENNDRKSREIYDLWVNDIVTNMDQLGSKKYAILEDVIIAALDCHKFGTVQKCIEELYKDFPKSFRVSKFEAMYLEGQKRYGEALNILDYIIKKDKTNSGARKRKIAILKAEGRHAEMIKELTEYLKTFAVDTEAWHELCNAYIAEHDFNKASFCMEELILQNPDNHLLYQRYADIKYTQGGLENFELAKAYYLEAIKLNRNNLRALYGLYLVLTVFLTSSKTSSQKKKENQKLINWVLCEITRQYNTNYAIEDCLSVLQIN